MLKSTLLISAAVLGLSACAPVSSAQTAVAPAERASAVVNDYALAIADPLRPASEVERDALRKPAEMLAFAQIEGGERIADIRPEEGYFARLFARAVGPEGRVYAFVPNQTAAREPAHADTLATDYPNVTPVTGSLEELSFPEPLDVVFTAQEYHDFVIERFNVDVAKMNAAVFAALKPGGLYEIIDHQAAAGAGTSGVGALHRIEGSALRAQGEAAGFIFDGETDVIRNPADDHSLSVFDEAIRGRSDQFVYRFRKPG